MRGPARPADRSEWVQLTNFPDSVTQPALSPDGKMLAFIHGDSTFFGPGQIFVKMLPDGEPVQLTHDNLSKMSPVFSADGTRIAYTVYTDEVFAWDTWMVPVLGGEPQLWLKNVSGLVWTGPHQLMFSEIKRGVHMGLVTAADNRMGARDIYLPGPEPNMAHRSYLSPDRKWVLLVEMDEDHLWEPCRVVPADGSSQGRKVGPPGGGCTAGAWTPDGKWIYLTSNAVGANHIWRQRFPGGGRNWSLLDRRKRKALPWRRMAVPSSRRWRCRTPRFGFTMARASGGFRWKATPPIRCLRPTARSCATGW